MKDDGQESSLAAEVAALRAMLVILGSRLMRDPAEAQRIGAATDDWIEALRDSAQPDAADELRDLADDIVREMKSPG